MGRCSKYEGEQSEWHPGMLTWPGIDYPYLGEYKSKLDAVEYIPVAFFRSKLFNLSQEEDVRHYEWVNDRIANGWFVQYSKQVKLVEGDGAVSVHAYLEWGQVYLIQSKKREAYSNDTSRPAVPWI